MNVEFIGVPVTTWICWVNVTASHNESYSKTYIEYKSLHLIIDVQFVFINIAYVCIRKFSYSYQMSILAEWPVSRSPFY